MAQQGKQMMVGARVGFAYNSGKLVLLANGKRYEVDSSTFFLSGKALSQVRSRQKPRDKFIVHLKTHDKLIVRVLHYIILC